MGGKTSIETVYAITSLTADEAGPVSLLQLSRDHWGIENKLHYVRDVSCREDQVGKPTPAMPRRCSPRFATPRWRSIAASVSSRSKDSNTSPNIAKPRSTPGFGPENRMTLVTRHPLGFRPSRSARVPGDYWTSTGSVQSVSKKAAARST